MSDAIFQTYQTISYYDRALGRHGQWVRWTRVMTCPCVDTSTLQADIHCNLCKGRGRLYRHPDSFRVFEEGQTPTREGKVFVQHPKITGNVEVWHKGCRLAVDSFDDTSIQLEKPFPPRHANLRVNYDFSPVKSVVGDSVRIVAPRILEPTDTVFREKGKAFSYAITAVNELRNVTRDEVVSVDEVDRNFIRLDDSYAWDDDDEWSVDYEYVEPFNFVISGITQQMVRTQPYISTSGEAVMLTPHWAVASPDDIFTALAVEQYETATFEGSSGSSDKLSNLFDVAKIVTAVDLDGTYYTPGTDLELVGRNEIKWLTPKPKRYSIQVLYHPSYRALQPFSTLRNAENKTFANKINLKLFTRSHEKVNF